MCTPFSLVKLVITWVGELLDSLEVRLYPSCRASVDADRNQGVLRPCLFSSSHFRTSSSSNRRVRPIFNEGGIGNPEERRLRAVRSVIRSSALISFRFKKRLDMATS